MNDTQKDLPLSCPPLPGDLPLLPARMINEYQYCPRLAYLEWVQGEWSESADTVEGRHVHRRVDQPSGDLPRASAKARSSSSRAVAMSAAQPASEADDALRKAASSVATPDTSISETDEQPEDDAERVHARSITLSAPRLGLIARLDLVEGEGEHVTPVDYKRGKRPHVPRGAYDPERVQLCVQAMILEDNGYTCTEASSTLPRAANACASCSTTSCERLRSTRSAGCA